MEPRRSTMGSPLSALLIDCAGPVLRVSTRGGRFWLAACGVRGGGGEGTRRPDGDTWSPSAMHAQVRGRAAERWPLRPAPARPSSYRSAYGYRLGDGNCSAVLGPQDRHHLAYSHRRSWPSRRVWRQGIWWRVAGRRNGPTPVAVS